MLRAAVLASALALALSCATTAPAPPAAAAAAPTPPAPPPPPPPAPPVVVEEPPAPPVVEEPPTAPPPEPVVEEKAPPAEEFGPTEEGLASYYADSLAGHRTASGEKYKPNVATCAHRKHPFGTILEVTSVSSGKSSRCRVNDRGPHIKTRLIDVSKVVAKDIGLLGRGVTKVRVRPVRNPSS